MDTLLIILRTAHIAALAALFGGLLEQFFEERRRIGTLLYWSALLQFFTGMLMIITMLLSQKPATLDPAQIVIKILIFLLIGVLVVHYKAAQTLPLRALGFMFFCATIVLVLVLI